jgi:hypothetical protein
MQSRYSGGGGSHKKFKCTIKKVIADGSPNSDAATNALAEKEPINNANSADSSIDSCPVEKPLTNSPTAETTAVEVTVMSASDHPNTESAFHSETATGSLPPNEHTNVKRSVLDESGSTLENVLEALRTQNTDRIAAAIPGKCVVLTDTEPILPKIITGIVMNCVNTISNSLASAIEIEKERLRESERNRLGQIKQDRNQMSLLSGARLKKQEQFQEEEERLPRETETAIACLSMRGIADRDLKDVLSEPIELTREFKEQDEFESLIRGIDKENAYQANMHSRASVKETYYWTIIQRHANMMGPLPGLPGRKTGITPQEVYCRKTCQGIRIWRKQGLRPKSKVIPKAVVGFAGGGSDPTAPLQDQEI